MQYKALTIIILSAIVLTSAATFAEGTPGGFWDMSGSTITKVIPVPTNEPNYPAGRVNQSREVLEDADGDIVFGIWKETNNAFLQNPFVEDGALAFYGGQTAYIENVFDRVTNFRLSFDFKPTVINKAMTILQVTSSWEIRTEVGAGDNLGTTRLRCYANTYVPAAGKVDARTANSDWTVTAGQWHHVELWVQDNRVHLMMDGVEVFPDGGLLETGLWVGLYPNLFIGSRWDGVARWFEGSVDNIQITYYENTCGAWGFNPMDFNYDCYVNMADFAYFANTWLDCTDPALPGCVSGL